MAATLRPYRPEDARAVVSLLARIERDDPDVRAPSAQAWEAFLGRSFNAGGRDFALAEMDGEPVGLLQSARLEKLGRPVRHVRALVLPSRRRLGVATRLLEHGAAQDPPGEVLVQGGCPDSWRAGVAFAKAHGFCPAHASLDMRREAGPVAPGALASLAGLAVGPDRGDADDADWIRLNDLGYRGSTDHVSLTQGDLAVFRREAGFRLAFARAGGEAVGLCHVVEYMGRLYVNSLVVAPPWRRRGVGRLLLTEALVARGAHCALHLGVREENAPAVALYRSLGFETIDVVRTWTRAPPTA